MMAIVPLLFVHIPQPEKKLAGVVSPRQVLLDVREGFRYISALPGMLILLGMATLINMLFNPAFSLMPLMITREFHGEAMQLGIINSFFGVGVILGGLGLGAWGGFKRKLYTSMTGLVGMALGMLVIAIGAEQYVPGGDCRHGDHGADEPDYQRPAVCPAAIAHRP